MAKQEKEEKAKLVLIDANGIDILITTDDPWYNDLSKEWGNGTPVNEDDFDMPVDYSNDEI